MGGHLMVWGMVLVVVIDVAMITWGYRRIARMLERGCQARTGCAISGTALDDDDGVFEPSSDERYSHGLLTNPATGLPMLDGGWVDVAGNPYGTDLSSQCDSSFDGSGSSDFNCGFGSLNDW